MNTPTAFVVRWTMSVTSPLKPVHVLSVSVLNGTD
jgi:hypothetical protein